MRKNLQHLQLNSIKKIAGEENLLTKSFITNEGVSIKSDYSEKDLLHIEQLDFAAGFPPYLRGINTTMYVRNPWEINQDSEYSTALETNSFFKKKHIAGQKNISVIFDLPTQKGYDSDDKQTASEVGIAGLAIDSVEDMKILFDQIPLDEVSVSMTMCATILPLIAFYIVAAEEQGIEPNQLSGCILDTSLNEFILENKQKYTPEFFIAVFECVQKKMPKFNAIHISALAIHEAKTTVAIELAYTLANGLEYIKTALNAGIKIDDIAPHLTFSFGIGMNHFAEIAKLRAARMIWARLIKQFNPENTNSLALQIHSKTSEENSTIKDPFNNITRTCIEAAAAVFGGTQSLQTHLMDKNRVEFSARIAKNTQLYLQEETKITKTVDPWGGSYYVECLTQEIIKNTWKHIEEIEKLGGFKKAIEADFLKLQIEEVATKKQIKNYDTIYEDQIKRLNQVKATRNFENVKVSLNKIKESSQKDMGDLFELTLEAARNRATIGEISEALESLLRIYKR